MKRYLLFSGMTFYPAGGWGDFIDSFETPEAARGHAQALGNDWWEVVDTATGKVLEPPTENPAERAST